MQPFFSFRNVMVSNSGDTVTATYLYCTEAPQTLIVGFFGEVFSQLLHTLHWSEMDPTPSGGAIFFD